VGSAGRPIRWPVIVGTRSNGIALGTTGHPLPSHGRHCHAGLEVAFVPEGNG
jgi:hypothetical protein